MSKLMSHQIDRALEILLFLRSKKTVSATVLAERFGVSTRTIYRDIETLSAAGVPVYAELGREGGFRLLEGYFLPPIMFSAGEATSLLIGLHLLNRLRAKPFAATLATAEQKLLAVTPEHLRAMLLRAPQMIGFEEIPPDLFHTERASRPPAPPVEDAAISTFLQATLEQKMVQFDYHSPYRNQMKTEVVIPRGLLWDRDRWYLIGMCRQDPENTRLWRADRVQAIEMSRREAPSDPTFDISHWLGRRWLDEAMATWMAEAPVVIRLTKTQATRLQQDWYYRHAHFAELTDTQVQMTFGEDDCEVVMQLLRWLGPGAELIAPTAWRTRLREELLTMAAIYSVPAKPSPPARSSSYV